MRHDHAAIADAIAAELALDGARSGARLPTQKDLGVRFGASRHTIRRAIDLLERRGVLGGRQGSGTYVTGQLVDYRISSRTRYNENVRPLDPSPTIEFLELQTRRATPELSRALAIARQAPIHDLMVLRRTNREPLCLARHYLSVDRFPSLADHLEHASGITDLLRRLGTDDFQRNNSAISARMPSNEEAFLLAIPRDSPVVVLEGRNIDPAGVPVEISTSVWPAARIRVHV